MFTGGLIVLSLGWLLGSALVKIFGILLLICGAVPLIFRLALVKYAEELDRERDDPTMRDRYDR